MLDTVRRFAASCLHTICAFLPGRTISQGGVAVFHRHYIVTSMGDRYPTLSFHHIVSDDKGEEPHDHPNPHTLSLILLGGYDEHRWDRDGKYLGMRHLRPGNINHIPGDVFHLLLLPPGVTEVWTLCSRWGGRKLYGRLNLKTGWVTQIEAPRNVAP